MAYLVPFKLQPIVKPQAIYVTGSPQKLESDLLHVFRGLSIFTSSFCGCVSSRKPQIHLTHEQQQILSHDIQQDHVVKIVAFAGTAAATAAHDTVTTFWVSQTQMSITMLTYWDEQ